MRGFMQDCDLIDLFRVHHRARREAFTMWNMRTGARVSNYGTRLDYILVDSSLIPSSHGPEADGSMLPSVKRASEDASSHALPERRNAEGAGVEAPARVSGGYALEGTQVCETTVGLGGVACLPGQNTLSNWEEGFVWCDIEGHEGLFARYTATGVL